MNELALFAGAGGGILGGKLLGWRTVCAVEWDAYARDVLVARQNDGCLEPFPIWNDVQTFDGRPWRGIVDVVSGGFPCQDISAAGKGAGIEGERSGMWKHMARIIGEVLPQFVFVENSPLLVGRGLAVVLADLAAMGYDAQWGIVGAHHATAPHKRDRIWVLGRNANSNDVGEVGRIRQGEASATCGIREAMADATGRESRKPTQWERRQSSSGRSKEIDDVADASPSGLQGGDIIERMHGEEGGKWAGQSTGSGGGIIQEWWATEPDVGRVAHGVAARVDRLRCIGNGQVPAVVRLAWETFSPLTTP
jgi:DNA (cytosine-5)-methyltransferase 1